MMTVIFDLDDTLFPEMDFVRSAYKAIAMRHGLHLLPAMLSAPTPREAFDSTGLPVEELLGIYRTHFPDIRLPWESLYTLATLRAAGHSLGLITDGRAVTQRNKIAALRLDRFIDLDLIFISEEVGSDKTSGEAVRSVMERRPGDTYIYVGDNPAKDFIAPCAAGWQTVMLLDRGENIHPQVFAPASPPDFKIHSLLQLISIL